MRILILGANGFIGSAVTLGMIQHGHQVFAVARDIAAGQRRLWEAEWIKVDLARLLTPKDWRPLLRGVDAVVNCAGALQDSARDNVEALQLRAMQALYAAAPRSMLVVQISARTDGAARDTAFLASKHAADEALKASGLSHVILRPAVVVGRGAYGGSALLRGLAAMPFVTPVLAPKSAIQFAAIDDVVVAVADALGGKLPDRTDIEIAGPRKWTLAEAVARHRQWLGLAPAKTIPVPRWIGRIVAAGADQLARLGWRSPLRSTAMLAISGGVTATAASPDCRDLDEYLTDNPAGVADLWFARLYLLKPLAIGALSFFWIVSGFVALLRLGAASAHLEAAGFGPLPAALLTVLTSLADIALGMFVLVRRRTALALQGMVALSLLYLAAATLMAPSLWIDPLGPLVKVLPSIVLALVALATLEDR